MSSPAARPPVPHPSIDGSDPEVVVTETRARVVHLSESRADLLAQVVEAGRRPLLVSGEQSRLTFAMRQVLTACGGHWVVRSPDGTLRDGLDGRHLSSLKDAVLRAPAGTPADAYLRPERADTVQLLVSQSVRHKASATTVLGLTAELLATRLAGAPPAGWGVCEPAGTPWDRAALTEHARSRMPADTTLVVAGPVAAPSTATIRVRRTDHGLEETTEALLAVGPPGSDAARARIDALPDVLTQLSARQMPLFGLVTARTGRADLLTPPVLEAPVVPLAMLVGPPGVRELRLDVAHLTTRLGAVTVGNRRAPGLLFRLGSMDSADWGVLEAVVREIGADRVRGLLGSPGSELEGVLGARRP